MKKSHKFLAYILTLLIVISLTIGCVENTDKENGQDTEQAVLLTLISGSYQANYTLEDIEALDSYSGTGGYINSVNIISEILEYTGVQITTLLDEITDIPENYTISVVSDDGWTVNFTKNQTIGIVDVYNETGDIIENETAVMILAYKEDGSYYSEIDPDSEIGPLRIAFVGDDVITSSKLWSKMVVSIEI